MATSQARSTLVAFSREGGHIGNNSFYTGEETKESHIGGTFMAQHKEPATVGHLSNPAKDPTIAGRAVGMPVYRVKQRKNNNSSSVV